MCTKDSTCAGKWGCLSSYRQVEPAFEKFEFFDMKYVLILIVIGNHHKTRMGDKVISPACVSILPAGQ